MSSFLERLDGRATDFLSAAVYSFKKNEPIQTADKQTGTVIKAHFRKGEVIVLIENTLEAFPGRYIACPTESLPYKEGPLGRPVSSRE